MLDESSQFIGSVSLPQARRQTGSIGCLQWLDAKYDSLLAGQDTAVAALGSNAVRIGLPDRHDGVAPVRAPLPRPVVVDIVPTLGHGCARPLRRWLELYVQLCADSLTRC